jgi:hypothetical protein
MELASDSSCCIVDEVKLALNAETLSADNELPHLFELSNRNLPAVHHETIKIIEPSATDLSEKLQQATICSTSG